MFMNLVSIHQSYSYSLMMLREIERHTDNTQVKKEDSPKLSLWLRTGTSRCLKWSRMQKTSWIKNVSEKRARSHALHLVTLRTWCRPKSQGQGWQTSANQGIYIYVLHNGAVVSVLTQLGCSQSCKTFCSIEIFCKFHRRGWASSEEGGGNPSLKS